MHVCACFLAEWTILTSCLKTQTIIFWTFLNDKVSQRRDNHQRIQSYWKKNNAVSLPTFFKVHVLLLKGYRWWKETKEICKGEGGLEDYKNQEQMYIGVLVNKSDKQHISGGRVRYQHVGCCRYMLRNIPDANKSDGKVIFVLEKGRALYLEGKGELWEITALQENEKLCNLVSLVSFLECFITAFVTRPPRGNKTF